MESMVKQVYSSVPAGNYTVKVVNTANGYCTSTHTMTIENEPIYPIVEDIFVTTVTFVRK